MKKRLILSAHQFLFFSSSVTLSFNVVLMQSRGFSNTTIGIVLAGSAMVAIVMQPVWGLISDWMQSTRKVYMICSVLSCIVYALLCFQKTAGMYGAVYFVFTAFSCVLTSLVNTTCLVEIAGDRSISFGGIRIWGSIGFAVMSYIIGQFFARGFSVDLLFPVYIVFGLANTVLAVFIKDSAPSQRQKVRNLPIKELFKNYYFVTFLIFIFLSYIGISSTFSYSINVITHLGGSTETAGTVFAIRALAEIPFFMLSAVLIRKFGARMILFFSVFLFFAALLCYGFTQSLHVVLAAHVVQGPAYGLLLTSVIYYVYDLSPEQLKATSQTIAMAVQTGFGSMVGSFLTGRLTDSVGVSKTYQFLAWLSAVALVFFLITLYIGKKKRIPYPNE